MGKRDPFLHPKLERRLPTLATSLRRAKKRPTTGVTQGGSSRKGSPAKVAATDGRFRPSKQYKHRGVQ